ncbi:hypothetical protein L9F63_005782, partial [Diploptera punctata]
LSLKAAMNQEGLYGSFAKLPDLEVFLSIDALKLVINMFALQEFLRMRRYFMNIDIKLFSPYTNTRKGRIMNHSISCSGRLIFLYFF